MLGSDEHSIFNSYELGPLPRVRFSTNRNSKLPEEPKPQGFYTSPSNETVQIALSSVARDSYNLTPDTTLATRAPSELALTAKAIYSCITSIDYR